MSSKQLLVAIVAIALMAGFATAFVEVAEVAVAGTPRGNIGWVRNCGGPAYRTNFTVSSCESQGCLLKVRQNYSSGFNFRPSTANITSLHLTVSASRGPVFQTTFYNLTLNTSSEYTVTYPLSFGDVYANKNISRQQQNITVGLYGNGTRQEVCATFDVFINPSATGSGSVISFSILLLAIKQLLVYLNI